MVVCNWRETDLRCSTNVHSPELIRPELIVSYDEAPTGAQLLKHSPLVKMADTPGKNNNKQKKRHKMRESGNNKHSS